MILFFVAAIPGICSAAPLMVEKNIFAQDRKPPTADSAGASNQPNAQAVPPKAIQLDGIMIRGNVRKALLRIKGATGRQKEKDKPESPFITVQEGEKISDYEVKKIGIRSVSLEKAGQIYDVALYAEGKVLPPMAKPPSPPPPVAAPEAAAGAQPPGSARRNAPPRPGAPPGRGQINAPPEEINANVAGAQPQEAQSPPPAVEPPAGVMPTDEELDAEDGEGDEG